MKIGLVNIEPKIINNAYLQINGYYKSKGDVVEWYSALFHGSYDKIFCSSLFSFTDKSQVPKEAICGGTGFPELISVKLPREIEEAQPDYSIYTKFRKSLLWFSRGCDYGCPFCLVGKKEGKLHTVEPKQLNPKGKEVMVMDNSFFDSPGWREHLFYLEKGIGQKVQFYGVKAKTFTEEQGEALKQLKIPFVLHCAWDNPKEQMIPHLQFMAKFVPKRCIRVYYLIGYWSTIEEDQMRSDLLLANGFDGFAMPYDRTDPYQRARARWENHKAIRKTVPFSEYHQGAWNPKVLVFNSEKSKGEGT
jgi:hypothetical protein